MKGTKLGSKHTKGVDSDWQEGEGTKTGRQEGEWGKVGSKTVKVKIVRNKMVNNWEA